jgi:hypothetical protein
MRIFTTRERPDIAKLADVTGEIREFVRQQKDSNADGGQPPANNLASLLQRVTGAPEREIDHLTYCRASGAARKAAERSGARTTKSRRLCDLEPFGHTVDEGHF